MVGVIVAAVAAVSASTATAAGYAGTKANSSTGSTDSITVTAQSSGSVTLLASASQKDASQSTSIEVMCKDGTDTKVTPVWTRSGGSLVDSVTFTVSTTPGVACQGTLNGPVGNFTQVFATTYFSTI